MEMYGLKNLFGKEISFKPDANDNTLPVFVMQVDSSIGLRHFQVVTIS